MNFLKPHISKKKDMFWNFCDKNLSDGTLKSRKFKLEVFLNWILKKVVKVQKNLAPCLNPPRHGAIFFWNLTHFFDIQLKKTSNLIFLDFKVPSERFFSQEFQNRSYFLKYVVLTNRKLSPKLSTNGWDTLYKCTYTAKRSHFYKGGLVEETDV